MMQPIVYPETTTVSQLVKRQRTNSYGFYKVKLNYKQRMAIINAYIDIIIDCIIGGGVFTGSNGLFEIGVYRRDLKTTERRNKTFATGKPEPAFLPNRAGDVYDIIMTSSLWNSYLYKFKASFTLGQRLFKQLRDTNLQYRENAWAMTNTKPIYKLTN